MALMWAGVVPQQPPTRLSSPRRARSPRTAAIDSGVSSYPPSSLGSPAFGWVLTSAGETREQVGHVGRDQVGTERAIEADDERIRVRHRVPERFHRLAREGASAPVDDGPRDPDRQPLASRLEHFIEGEQRRLRVEGVEDGLDQDQVRAAVDQRVASPPRTPRATRRRRCSGSPDSRRRGKAKRSGWWDRGRRPRSGAGRRALHAHPPLRARRAPPRG